MRTHQRFERNFSFFYFFWNDRMMESVCLNYFQLKLIFSNLQQTRKKYIFGLNSLLEWILSKKYSFIHLTIC